MHAPSIVRRTSALRVWSSAPGAQRFLRPTDILLLAASLVTLALLDIWAPGPTSLDEALVSVTTTVSELLDWLWEISYALLAGWAVIVVALAVFSRGRRRMLLDFLIAAAIAFAGGLVAFRFATGSWPQSLSDFATAEAHPVYTVAFLTVAVAILVTASPHLTRPLRMIGRLVILFGMVAAVGLTVTLPIGAAASLAVGVAAAATTHLLMGTPAGRSTPDQVADALGELGLDIDSVREAAVQEPGVSVMLARAADGRSLFVKVYGRDAWDGQVVGSMWTSLTRRGEKPVLLRSRVSRVDHEAVVTLIAQRAGINVVPIVTGGKAEGGDALLVTEMRGASLADLDSVDDAFVASAWAALVKLHSLGIAHGDISSGSVVRDATGAAALCDFDEADLNADPSSLLADRARLLVVTALAADRDRAVAAAIEAIGKDGLADVLPYLQPAVVDSDTGRAVREEEWTLAELRAAAVAACGVEAPPLQKLRRVTLRSIIVVAIIALVAYTLIGLLAGVDFASIKDELSAANKAILLGALVLSPFVQVGFSIGTMGASPRPLRFRPVLMLQYAIQFIALTLPSTAARIALEVRFFERFGLPAATAVSIGVIDSVSGFGVQIALILLILVSGLPGFTSSVLGSSSSSSSTDSSTPSLLILLLVLLAAGVLIAVVVPRIRHRIVGSIPRIRAAIREQAHTAKSSLTVLRNPRKVGLMLLGNFIAQLIQAIILGVCLAAFGDTAHLSQLILINTAVSLFAGLMPVPGGMGVAEAGYTLGLQAIGIPSAVAMSTAIAFRLVTFYLPPIWGAYGMRWLRKNAYV